LFGKSRQSVYQAERREAERRERLSPVRELVATVRRKMPRLGTRKLHYLLGPEFRAQGIKLGRDGLFAYLSSEGLLIKPKKNYTKTTYTCDWRRRHPNLLAGRKPERCEEVFVSDITYIKSRERTHYLSLVTDAFSRKIMGYHLSDDMSG
jgi:transposase InsO family protein